MRFCSAKGNYTKMLLELCCFHWDRKSILLCHILVWKLFLVRTQSQSNSLVLYSLLLFLHPSGLSPDLFWDTPKQSYRGNFKKSNTPTQDSYISTPKGMFFLFQEYLTSGVTSRGANPVPPVVKIKLSSFSSHQSISVSWKRTWMLSDLTSNTWDMAVLENT